MQTSEQILQNVHYQYTSGTLPAHLRSTLISRREFRDGLKSHLFADAYFWSSENIRYKTVMYLLTYLLTYLCVCKYAATMNRQWSTDSCCTWKYVKYNCLIHKTPNVVLKVVKLRKIIAKQLQIECTGLFLQLKIDVCQKAFMFCPCLFCQPYSDNL